MRTNFLLCLLLIFLLAGCAQPQAQLKDSSESISQQQDKINKLERAATLNPNPQAQAIIWFNIGTEYHSAGRFSDAIEAYQKSINLNSPYHGEAYTHIADCHQSLGKWTQAASAQKKVVEIFPQQAIGYIRLSYYCFRGKDYDAAIVAARQALAIDPNNANAFNLIGASYGHKGQYQEAIKALRRATELDPKDANNFAVLGEFFLKSGAYQEAVAAHRRAIEVGSNSPVTYLRLGICYFRLGNYDEAIAWKTKAIEASPPENTATATYLGARSLSYRCKGRMDSAYEDARRAYHLNPSDSEAQFAMGAVHFDRSEFEEAVRVLEKTDVHNARVIRASASARLGKVPEAIEILKSISYGTSLHGIPCSARDLDVLMGDLKPYVKDHLDKARSFEAKGRAADALSEYVLALKASTGTDAQSILSSMFSIVRKSPALGQVPEEARRYAIRSETLVKQGDFAGALSEIKKAIGETPYIGQFYYNAALIQAELKLYRDAIVSMNVFLMAAPDSPHARAAKDEIIKWELMIEKGK